MPSLQSPSPGLTTQPNAYKTHFEELTAKGVKLQLNIMDNQATKHIKKILTKNKCKLQVVEPHYHCVNAAKRAIQTFKAAFIAALAATDSDFPLQLWGQLNPQVEDTLNMLRALRIDPTKSAYKILNRLYYWNQYLLAPLGCKAVVYEDGAREVPGHPVVWMHFTLARQRIITDATNITYRKSRLTVSWGPLSCTHNIVSCHP